MHEEGMTFRFVSVKRRGKHEEGMIFRFVSLKRREKHEENVAFSVISLKPVEKVQAAMTLPFVSLQLYVLTFSVDKKSIKDVNSQRGYLTYSSHVCRQNHDK